MEVNLDLETRRDYTFYIRKLNKKGGETLTQDRFDKISKELEDSTEAYLLFAVTEQEVPTVQFHMDTGDALMLINFIIRELKLDPDSVAFACKKWLEDQEKPKDDLM
ncbi:MAG: hypothetical protein K6U74_04875 [Firmicutes bacterium]|nr:hypothetical protein [Bacillota bacterium]